MAKRKPGRPEGASDTRDMLLQSARHCFVNEEYRKVTTRAIAEHAGTNLAMIHYYFGNKENLYLTMLSETLKPFDDDLNRRLAKPNDNNLASLIRAFYKTMARFPEFPPLLIRIMQNESEVGQAYLKSILGDGILPRFNRMLHDLQRNGEIADNLDIEKLQIVLLSLMVHPFAMTGYFNDHFGGKPKSQDYISLGEFVAEFAVRAVQKP
ncbi:TetR/AcrR family transcriptional regulator [Motilimonas cestriensis]|uniref:TetR/AcrR family transcriptional regulator n=1 Tax=Motilimonas cestriensis TaxID=2742685 RepID=A0ABS8W6C5_9GAMM|nr:TetR/AcrR family transcriptional regulator [Motilimonas cestriensis]